MYLKCENCEKSTVTFITLAFSGIIRTGNGTCVSYAQLQGAAVLGQPVGFGTSSGGNGGHRSGGSLPGNLDRRPQQVYLFPMHILHVVLQKVEKEA